MSLITERGALDDAVVEAAGNLGVMFDDDGSIVGFDGDALTAVERDLSCDELDLFWEKMLMAEMKDNSYGQRLSKGFAMMGMSD